MPMSSVPSFRTLELDSPISFKGYIFRPLKPLQSLDKKFTYFYNPPKYYSLPLSSIPAIVVLVQD
jgi:hypothetical protein